MANVNSIKFLIQKNDKLVLNGIDFSRSIFIRPLIDDIDMFSDHLEQNALMVFSEWKMCSKKSGDYLLFTSLIGIADDGGWRLCPTHHEEGFIFINMPYDNRLIEYKLDKNFMQMAIKELEDRMVLIISKEPDFHLEPTDVIFPE